MRQIALTHEIRTAGSPLYRFFHGRFPNVAPMVEEFRTRLEAVPTSYPPGNEADPPWSTIGTAIDYRLLYYFWAKPFRALDAFKGAVYSYIGDPKDMVGIPWQANLAASGGMTMVPRLVHDYFADLDMMLHQLQPVRRRLAPEQEAEICRYCFVLALFEQVLRTHQLPPTSPLQAFNPKATATAADLLSLADPWVDDLCQLSWLFYERQRKMFSQQAWIHPRNLWRMAGAEADLLLEGYVIDFKTTTNPKLDPTWLYQVLGYVLLEYPPEHPVQGVGLYMVRQGVLVRWRLGNLLLRLMHGSPVALEVLQTEFRQVLTREYGLMPSCSMRTPRSRMWIQR